MTDIVEMSMWCVASDTYKCEAIDRFAVTSTVKSLSDSDVHTVLLYLDVADPATFLASNSVQGTLFSSENSLFIQFVLLRH